MPKCNSNDYGKISIGFGFIITLRLHFGTRAYLFLPEEGSCYVFSTGNNCCEFLASDGVIFFQSVIKSFFKTPVFGAPLTINDIAIKIFYYCHLEVIF